MIRLSSILIAVLIAFGMYWFSAARSKRMLDRESSPLVDPILKIQIEKLALQLDLQEIPVRVYDVDMVNGLAAPDGRVFLTRGFIEKYRKGEVAAEELVSVVAHELGHVALGHSQKRMIDFVSSSALRTILMVVLGRTIPFVGPYLANWLVQMITARLSRNDEFEADAYAAALMTKAGFGVAPQIELFKKLEKLSGGKPQAPAWFLSHPKTEERIAAIEKLDVVWREGGSDA